MNILRHLAHFFPKCICAQTCVQHVYSVINHKYVTIAIYINLCYEYCLFEQDGVAGMCINLYLVNHQHKLFYCEGKQIPADVLFD